MGSVASTALLVSPVSMDTEYRIQGIQDTGYSGYRIQPRMLLLYITVSACTSASSLPLGGSRRRHSLTDRIPGAASNRLSGSTSPPPRARRRDRSNSLSFL